MANNRIQVKRTSVSGRTANVTNSGNSQYIAAGEFALNMPDGILYSSNGSALITVGANLVNQAVTNTTTFGNSSVNATINSTAFTGSANAATYLGSSINSGNSTGIYSTGVMTASGIVSGSELTSTQASGDEGGQVNLAKPPNATTAGGVTIDAYQNKLRIFEQGGNARGAYIDLTACANGVGTNLLGGTGTVTSVASANGIAGGPITGSGTLYAVAGNNTVFVNASGIHVNTSSLPTVNLNSQYVWTNTHTFQANVAFTGNNISVVTNTGSVMFGGAGDTNWRIGRSTGSTTKFYYSNNTLDILAAASNLEGVVIGQPGGNTYLETGYAGTFTRLPIYIGNSVVNVSINSTSFTGSANSATYANSSITNTFTVGTASYFVSNGNLGIGNNSPAHKLRVEGITSLDGNTTITENLQVGSLSTDAVSIGLGAAPSNSASLKVNTDITLDSSYLLIDSDLYFQNTAMTDQRNLYGGAFTIRNRSQHKTAAGANVASDILGVLAQAWNGDSGGDARLATATGIYSSVQNYANGSTSNNIGTATGYLGYVRTLSSGTITTAYGGRTIVGPAAANATVTGNVTTAFGYHTSVGFNTANASVGTGYLYYGEYPTGANVTGTAYGIYVSGEKTNYLSGNVGIGNTAPTHKLRVEGTTSLAGAVSGITTLAAGNTTITGFANVSSNINAASFNVGATQFANTTGVYATFMNSKTESNLNVNNATYFSGGPDTSYGRLVFSSPASGASDANYWTKICTWSSDSAQYLDAGLLLAITNSATGGLDSAIVSVFFRENNTGANPTVDVEMIAKGGPYGQIGADSFKVITGGFGTSMELWMQKKSTYGSFKVFEISRSVNGGTLTYTTGSSWQATEPTGTVNNVKSNGVDVYPSLTVGGRFLANSTHANATHLNGVAHTGYLTTSGTAANATLLNNKTESNLNVNTAIYHSSVDGDRNAGTKLPTTSALAVRFDFTSATSAGTGGNYAGVMTYAPWTGTTASTGDASYQLAFGSTAVNGGGIPKLNIRKGIDSTWNSWYTLLHSGNYSDYALPITGGTMSGTITSSATSIAIGTAGGATRGYLYNDTSGFGLLSSGAAWALRVDYGTTNITVPSGVLSIGDTTTSTGTRQLSVGTGRTGSGISTIDLIGDTTYTNYGGRLLRRGGANANTELAHRGTGSLNIQAEEAGTIKFLTSSAVRGTIDAGTFYWGTTINNANSSSSADAGLSITGGGRITSQFDNGFVMTLNRTSSDGAIINFNQAGLNEGSIGVSGATVSLTAFLGAHWGTLQNRERFDILPGTVLETINELVEWKVLRFTDDNDKEVRVVYEGPDPVGTVVDYEYEGTVYQALVEYEDPNLELNKHTKVKISDTEASKAVFGVFLSWCNEENDYQTDMNVASVGNYFIRISGDYEVQVGDLIESNGDGTGRPQDDDIIRSKTVGKVTTTIKQKIYDDGSYLVTAVLYCG